MISDFEPTTNWITRTILNSPWHSNIVHAVAKLELRDCWIAAGFVRDLVWSVSHGYMIKPSVEVDVIYFDPNQASRDIDTGLSQRLGETISGVDFQVKNQYRMAERNEDRQYLSSADAMSFWPETCTAVGVSKSDRGNGLIFCAPFGIDDLLNLVIKATNNDAKTISLAKKRITEKKWLMRYPKLKLSQEILSAAE